MERKKIGDVALGVLIALYCINVFLVTIGYDWFARSEARIFWMGVLFMSLPMFSSLAGAIVIYGKQTLSWWLTPMLAYIVVPGAVIATAFLRQGTLVSVQEGARNTQGFSGGAVLAVILIASALLLPLLVGGPIALATAVWAKHDWKKLVAIPAVSFIIITGIFFIYLLDRA